MARCRRASGSTAAAPRCTGGASRVNSVRGRRLLDDPARVHHRDLVGAAGDDAEVVGDEDHRHEPLALLLLEQVEDLGLHGDVERGGGLVGEQQLRAAGEAMAIITRWRMPPDSWCGYSLEPALGLGDADRLRAARARARWRTSCETSRWKRSPSVIWLPIFSTGLSEVIGSWKTIAICVPQSWRSSSFGASMISRPSNRMLPVRSTFSSGAGP